MIVLRLNRALSDWLVWLIAVGSAVFGHQSGFSIDRRTASDIVQQRPVSLRKVIPFWKWRAGILVVGPQDSGVLVVGLRDERGYAP